MIWSLLANLLTKNDEDAKKKQEEKAAGNSDSVLSKRTAQAAAVDAAGKSSTPTAGLTTAATKQPNSGLTTGDMVGIGLSVLGANEQQKAADKEAEDLKKQQEQDQARQEIIDRQNAQQQYQDNFNQERSLNLQGLDALANMRDESRKIKTNSRFRTDMLRAIKGGK
jgi:hypothetical protein